MIDHGTSPASVHGATTKKAAEPRTAMVRCTPVPDTRGVFILTPPSWFPAVIRGIGHLHLSQSLESGKTMIEQQGKKPADVAERVFQSIADRRSYILPHEELDGAVRDRLERALARSEPEDLFPR